MAERCQQVQPIVLLGKTAIEDRAITRGLLDVLVVAAPLMSECCFDFLGFELVSIQRLSGARPFALGNELGNVLAVLMLTPPLNTKVPGIAEDPLLFSVQKFTGGHNVANVGNGGIGAMNQAQRIVGTNVHFHSEVLFVPFLV